MFRACSLAILAASVSMACGINAPKKKVYGDPGSDSAAGGAENLNTAGAGVEAAAGASMKAAAGSDRITTTDEAVDPAKPVLSGAETSSPSDPPEDAEEDAGVRPNPATTPEDIEPPTCTEECHQDATCIAGVCECKSDFAGNGTECAPTCAQLPCYPGVTCIDSDSGFNCGACPAEYKGDGISCFADKGCSVQPCYEGVTCTRLEDEEPNYACGACPSGLEGDGVRCADINSCVSIPCFSGVACYDIAAPNSGYTCDPCPGGYEGDGESCSDIDGCAQNPCYEGVVCTDLQAPETGFSCGHCPPGLSGDGESCTDTDDCAGSPCFEGVSCYDAEAPSSGYTCDRCPAGFEGSGQNCSDVDGCASNACPAGVTCTDIAAPGTGYSCGECPSGRSGDDCTDTDGCATNPCFAEVACHDVAAPGSGFTCEACPKGYMGNGESCNIANECNSDSHQCGSHAGACDSGSNLGYNCNCPTGFTDSGGQFPRCYISGSYSFDYTGGATLDALNDDVNTCCVQGDFYISSSVDYQEEFYANNIGQGGLVKIDTAGTTPPLLDIPIPATGYARGGVVIEYGATYVAHALEPGLGYFVVFRVTEVTTTNISIDYVYVYQAGIDRL